MDLTEPIFGFSLLLPPYIPAYFLYVSLSESIKGATIGVLIFGVVSVCSSELAIGVFEKCFFYFFFTESISFSAIAKYLLSDEISVSITVVVESPLLNNSFPLLSYISTILL